MIIDKHDIDRFEKRLIIEDGERLHYIGKIDSHRQYGEHIIIISDDLAFPENINDFQLNIHKSIINPLLCELPEGKAQVDVRCEDGVITTAKAGDLEFLKHISNEPGFTILSSHKGNHYLRLARLSTVLKYLYRERPIYSNIINDGKVVELLDMLYLTTDPDKYINQILFSADNIRQLISVAEKILSEINPEHRYPLPTQEEQIALFLEMNKQKENKVSELVSDEFIERMQNHIAYKHICDQLTKGGFKLSPTQQFNSLQHAGLILSNKARVLYNLSDMGAGKTLMTVESIMLAQHITAVKVAKQLKDKNTERLQSISLPAIHIIAPTLSLKSSWIKTFELFVPLTKVDEQTYAYKIEERGFTFNGSIHLAGFTVKNGNVYVSALAPKATSLTSDYLIIDEVHQLLHRSIKLSKFITKEKTDTLIAHDQYRTFVLSGTLANLTTEQWFNLIQLLGIPDDAWSPVGQCTTSRYNDYIDSKKTTLRNALSQMAINITTQQNREFDPATIAQDRLQIDEATMTARESYFHTIYGPSIVKFQNGQDIADMLSGKRFSLELNPSVLKATNFELFYKLVSDSVVTAQSIQIATELFGEQQEQHKATVIKTKSPLTSDDISLLKRLHKIVEDVNIYKSRHIATRIANAILNLNDGLQTHTIYDILNQSAEKNTKFLSYLTQMDIRLLEDIAGSNLIHTPVLEETEKFAIVKDILQKEKDETFLIVVNTPETAITLSNALGVKSLSIKEMKDELNYQDVIDALYTKQNVVIVPQHMIKSSLDLVQANRLIQYQLNTDVSDIIQTQNRINRIGQTRETKAYYIATDVLQENIIELFLETYRNIKVAHKGIVELFVDMEQQIDVVSDYLANALDNTTAEPLTVKSTMVVTVDGQEVVANADVLAQLSDEQYQGVWYKNYIIVKSSSGESLILSEVDQFAQQPKVVSVHINKGGHLC